MRKIPPISIAVSQDKSLSQSLPSLRLRFVLDEFKRSGNENKSQQYYRLLAAPYSLYRTLSLGMYKPTLLEQVQEN